MSLALPEVPGLRLHPAREHACATGTHSHLADGRTLCLDPAHVGGTVRAVDGELAGQVVPAALARRLTPAQLRDPWAWWTRAEVCAKLCDVPILVWLATRVLPAEGVVDVDGVRVRLATHHVAGLVVSVGSSGEGA